MITTKKSDAPTMTIGDVAVRAGFTASTLRYYESAGILPNPARSGGQRRYGYDILDRLAVVSYAKEAGFTIKEIGLLLKGFSPDAPPSSRWKTLARSKLSEIEATISRARAMKRLLEEGLRCDCLRFDECGILLRRAANRDGKEKIG